MEAFKDPDMEEILVDFTKESDQLFEKLEDILDEYEDDPTQTAKLEEFGQVIDRVMGAAKSIGLNEMGKVCELGKIIGYKSSQVDDQELLEVVSAILFDALEILNKMNTCLKKKDFESFQKIDINSFTTRLSWLSAKFKHVERSSCDVGGVEENMKQDSIDELINGLGIK